MDSPDVGKIPRCCKAHIASSINNADLRYARDRFSPVRELRKRLLCSKSQYKKSAKSSKTLHFLLVFYEPNLVSIVDCVGFAIDVSDSWMGPYHIPNL